MTSVTQFTFKGDDEEIFFANNNKAFCDWKTKITLLLDNPRYTSNREIEIKNVLPFGNIRHTPNGFVFANINIFNDDKQVPACVFLNTSNNLIFTFGI